MRLWNRNFTILTIGSFISALGSAAAGIAIGILIYIETGSPLTLALFIVANIIPRVVTNFLVGPFVDRHSRRNIIIAIDYFYSIFFLILAVVLLNGYFNVLVFTAVGALLGIIDTIYEIAFMSLFPEVIPQGYHSKAYSISSLIWPISAAVMAPVAAYFIHEYPNTGFGILMLFNAGTFVITASIELLIKVKEKLNTRLVEGKQFLIDLKEGIQYYKKERGILGIGILFAAFSFVYAAGDLLRMPYFVSSSIYTIQHFSFLITAGAVGRMVGGVVHYLFKYPVKKRYLIAVCVYFTVEILDATVLFMPYFLMIVVTFIVGLLSVTSFNIRMSATQTYIPNEIRGRINSTQQLMWNVGAIIGVITIGLIAEYANIDYRWIIMGAASVSLTAIFLVPVRMKGEFKKIYNADV